MNYLVEQPPKGIEKLLIILNNSLLALQSNPELLQITLRHFHEEGFLEMYHRLRENQNESVVRFLDSLLLLDK